MNNKEVLNLDDLAEYLDCTVTTAAGLLHSKQIPAQKIGKSWKIHIDAVRDWLKSGADDPEALKKPYRKAASQPEAQA